MSLSIVFAFFASLVLLTCLIPFLRLWMLDQPNSRSSHRLPTPSGGGVSFVFVVAVSTVAELISISLGQVYPETGYFALVSIPLLSLPLAIIGLIDDRYSLPACLRFVAQLVTAYLLIFVSPLSSALFAFPFLLLVITGVINFTNFMDGLDGLVAGCMTVSIAILLSIFAAPWSLWSLVGSLLGFLVLNWSPAKLFMGDVGSTFLGAVFIGLVLQASSWIDAFGFLLLATPLLADSFLCVSRRLLAGQRVFQAHRLHLFQRLQQAGWSHDRVSLIYISCTAVLGVAMLVESLPLVLMLAVSELLIGVWLDQRVAVPFALASKS